MDQDRIKGRVKQVKGSVTENLGKVTGDPALEAEGKIERTQGTLQIAFGKVKDALRKP
jgi:uncharacterized protein YjbJ (UPF0337 family)